MAFTKNYITQKGLALNAKLLTGDELNITRVVGAFGADQGIDPSEYTSIGSVLIQFQTNSGVNYDRNSQPNRITIPIYWENSAQTATAQINEIAVFAEDPIDGEILYCIAASYVDAMPLVPFAEGALEITINIVVELSLEPNVNIILPPSIVYLTKPEADALYAKKIHGHKTNEIMDDRDKEGNSVRLDEGQKAQWDDINAIWAVLQSGSTEAIPVTVDTKTPLKYRIINNRGYYNQQQEAFMA